VKHCRYLALSFEGKVTSSIDVDSSVDGFKEAIESFDTIHTVKVRTDHRNSNGVGDCASTSWIVTFTHLVHENRQSSSLSDSVVAQVDIFENVKGMNPNPPHLIDKGTVSVVLTLPGIRYSHSLIFRWPPSAPHLGMLLAARE
jgi:hypothetical protein